MKSTIAVNKLNLMNSKITYFVLALVFFAQLISQGVQTAATPAPPPGTPPLPLFESNFQIGIGSYFYLGVLLMACLIPCLNFRKFMNLNVRKSVYLQGTALTYIVAAVAASGLNLAFYFTVDQLFANNITTYSINVLDVFGWINNGVFIAFIQQFAFLLLVAAVTHTLTTMQTFWYGWVIDIVLIAILSVFIPIAPLRNVLIKFFYLLIFNHNALLQIGLCLLLAAVVYLLSIIPVKHKII